MSGHSKWATTKRAKAVVDAKRGAAFTKIANTITIAAKEKGGDPESNPSLRMAIDKAKTLNMPKDNIERAIKRGTGELAGEVVVELFYEGIFPNNIQFVVKCLTDNKNRSASEVRHVFSKHGGNLGSVMWNFGQKGLIVVLKDILKEKNIDLETWQLELIDAGIEDFKIEDDVVLIFTQIDNLQKLKNILNEQNIVMESAEIEYVPKDKQILNTVEQEKMVSFMEALEELEDVNDYYSNFDI